jgi:transposase
LTAGQRHDITQAQYLLEGFDFERLIADRGYSAAHFIEYLLDRGIEAVIPPHQRAKVLREYDQWLYRERHLVECFIGKIKHFRRIFSRFDKPIPLPIMQRKCHLDDSVCRRNGLIVARCAKLNQVRVDWEAFLWFRRGSVVRDNGR